MVCPRFPHPAGFPPGTDQVFSVPYHSPAGVPAGPPGSMRFARSRRDGAPTVTRLDQHLTQIESFFLPVCAVLA